MLDLTHGSRIVAQGAPGAQEAANVLGDVIAAAPPVETPFDYLLPDLESQPDTHLPGDPTTVTANLRALGAAMVDDGPPVETNPAVEVNSTIPAVYTYWGQFIDHDITANTDRDGAVSDITKSPLVPLDPSFVTENLKNLRQPQLNLDNVYGNGPGLDGSFFMPDPGPADKGFYDGIKLRVGENTDAPGIPGVKIPPAADLSRDLPRIGPLLKAGIITEDDVPDSIKTDVNRDTRAFIGDLRNDENLIVAQFHLAMLRFHNNVVDAVDDPSDPFGVAGASDADRFATVRRLVQFHYQWLVINDYLKTVTLPGVVDTILIGGNKFYAPLASGELYAPLEYSVAAYRFGHSMVRGGYDHNRNFGKPVPPAGSVQPFAKFEDLFRFTGNGFMITNPADPTKSTRNPFRGAPTLPFNWIIEWDRMTNKADANETHFARKIDTRLAMPILNMVNEGNAAGIQDDTNPANKPLRQLLRSLAQRNLLRGYLLSIPTGQAVADAMGVTRLTEDELRQGNTPAMTAALEAGGFLAATPLWYYVLKEAEIRANGNSLGELGSRIVAETQIGLIRNDPDSYLNATGGWDPSQGVKLPNGDPIVTIRGLFTFAGLAA